VDLETDDRLPALEDFEQTILRHADGSFVHKTVATPAASIVIWYAWILPDLDGRKGAHAANRRPRAGIDTSRRTPFDKEPTHD